MENIRVSIIVPIYNVEKYLEECLESLVNQTLQEIEIILVVDGSTDGSETIARKYTDRYNNIRMIVQENQGQSSARNAGMGVAQGKYVYFVDSDDYISLNAMELLYSTAEEKNAEVVLFDAEVFLDNLDKYEYTHMESASYYDRGENYNEVVTGQEMFCKMYKNETYRSSVCLLFIKRKFLIEKKIEFYKGIIHEDELFTFRLLFDAQRVIHINEKLFHRRLRNGSTMTGSKTRKHFEGCYVVIDNLILKYAELEMDEEMQRTFKQFIADNIVIGFNWFADMNVLYRKQLRNEFIKLGEYARVDKYTRRLYILLRISPSFYKIVRSIKRYICDREKKNFDIY